MPDPVRTQIVLADRMRSRMSCIPSWEHGSDFVAGFDGSSTGSATLSPSCRPSRICTRVTLVMPVRTGRHTSLFGRGERRRSPGLAAGVTSFGTTSAFSAAFGPDLGVDVRAGDQSEFRVVNGADDLAYLSRPERHNLQRHTLDEALPLAAGQRVPGDGDRHSFLHTSEFRLVDVDTNPELVQAADFRDQFSGIQVAARLDFQPVQDAVHRALDLSARETLRRRGRTALRFLQPGFRGRLVGLRDKRRSPPLE